MINDALINKCINLLSSTLSNSDDRSHRFHFFDSYIFNDSNVNYYITSERRKLKIEHNNKLIFEFSIRDDGDNVIFIHDNLLAIHKRTISNCIVIENEGYDLDDELMEIIIPDEYIPLYNIYKKITSSDFNIIFSKNHINVINNTINNNLWERNQYW